MVKGFSSLSHLFCYSAAINRFLNELCLFLIELVCVDFKKLYCFGGKSSKVIACKLHSALDNR